MAASPHTPLHTAASHPTARTARPCPTRSNPAHAAGLRGHDFRCGARVITIGDVPRPVQSRRERVCRRRCPASTAPPAGSVVVVVKVVAVVAVVDVRHEARVSLRRAEGASGGLRARPRARLHLPPQLGLLLGLPPPRVCQHLVFPAHSHRVASCAPQSAAHPEHPARRCHPTPKQTLLPD